MGNQKWHLIEFAKPRKTGVPIKTPPKYQKLEEEEEDFYRRSVMFSISAINDTDSRNQLQSLAPTKEAQEFHLSQAYHDGLVSLQAKDYEKARELLELVLKDPLVSNAQVENSARDGHLLQLRFLALKNLATIFLQQGPSYNENALRCYIQAVEIDSRDCVVWNQLGTLSCSMGLLSISRWAFEQGLICSPTNWNCMEKLLEVLIAIGDEVACLSVSELILRHWPSHSRALHVKYIIEDSETIPFTPRGIDKLEPKHIRLKFPEKRKARDEDSDLTAESKKLKQNINVQLSEASWIALVGEILEILSQSSTSGNVGLTIQLSSSAAKSTGSVENKGISCMPVGAGVPFSNFNSGNEKEGTIFDEQPHERRSSRLERLRSRKPGKDDLDFSTNKDHAKDVKQFLAPYLVDGSPTLNCKDNPNPFNSLYSECSDVIEFVQNNSDNFGAYHISHLLLEKIASRTILYQDNIAKVLDLEKVTRHCGLERTSECSLFLSELYYDMGLQSLETSRRGFMLEASYHLCKIIESVALEYPFHISGMGGKINDPMTDETSLRNKPCFWIRFFWLSARLSLLEGDKVKAQRELSIALALFTDRDENMNFPLGSICLAHCKVVKELTVDRVIHELNLIEVDYLLKNSVSEMLEKSMHAECIKMLSPLLLFAKDVHFDVLRDWGDEGKGSNLVELSALDVLIKTCDMAEPMNVDVYLNCHKRKLQILLAGAGLEGNSSENTTGFDTFSESKCSSHLIAEEVKAISQRASQIKSIINCSKNFKNIPVVVIGDIQSLLLTFMCNIANSCFYKKSSGLGVLESIEQTEQCYFVDAAIAFCKLYYLNVNISIKSQAELVVAIHDMLAEFGICCARGSCEEQDGTFLKFAVKHLLALYMKLKGEETKFDQQTSKDDQFDTEVGKTDKDKTISLEKDAVGSLSAESFSSHLDNEQTVVKCDSDVGYVPDSMFINEERENSQTIGCGNELTKDERDELELIIDNALDQCFYCLYGLNLRLDSSSEEDLVKHKNTSQGDYQTKEQCADVLQYILPYAKASSRNGMIKLRRVLRAIGKHFPKPPDSDLAGNAIDKLLDNSELWEDKLSKESGSEGFIDTMMKTVFLEKEPLKLRNSSSLESSNPHLEVYRNLYYLPAQSEDISATDKWVGFVLTKEGNEFVEQSANLVIYDDCDVPVAGESKAPARALTGHDHGVEPLVDIPVADRIQPFDERELGADNYHTPPLLHSPQRHLPSPLSTPTRTCQRSPSHSPQRRQRPCTEDNTHDVDIPPDMLTQLLDGVCHEIAAMMEEVRHEVAVMMDAAIKRVEIESRILAAKVDSRADEILYETGRNTDELAQKVRRECLTMIETVVEQIYTRFDARLAEFDRSITEHVRTLAVAETRSFLSTAARALSDRRTASQTRPLPDQRTASQTRPLSPASQTRPLSPAPYPLQ